MPGSAGSLRVAGPPALRGTATVVLESLDNPMGKAYIAWIGPPVRRATGPVFTRRDESPCPPPCTAMLTKLPQRVNHDEERIERR